MTIPRLFRGFGSLLLILFLSTPVSGQTSSGSETLSQRWSLGFAGQDKQSSGQGGTPPSDLLQTTFSRVPSPLRLRSPTTPDGRRACSAVLGMLLMTPPSEWHDSR